MYHFSLVLRSSKKQNPMRLEKRIDFTMLPQRNRVADTSDSCAATETIYVSAIHDECKCRLPSQHVWKNANLRKRALISCAHNAIFPCRIHTDCINVQLFGRMICLYELFCTVNDKFDPFFLILCQIAMINSSFCNKRPDFQDFRFHSILLFILGIFVSHLQNQRRITVSLPSLQAFPPPHGQS